MEQLRYGGVLEAVRVARSGFPVRLPHKEFYGRYRPLLALSGCLLPVKLASALMHIVVHTAVVLHSQQYTASTDSMQYEQQRQNSVRTPPVSTADAARKRCEELVKTVLVPVIASAKGIPADTIQFGKTKARHSYCTGSFFVFLRKNAYDALEMLRSRRLVDAAITAQALCRGFVYRRAFKKQRRGVIDLQHCILQHISSTTEEHIAAVHDAAMKSTTVTRHHARVVRGMMARRLAHRARRRRAATRIQTRYRRRMARRRYTMLQRAVLALQVRVRGGRARAVYKTMQREAAAIKLQRWGRMTPLRKKHLKLKSAVLSLQCALRRKVAKATVRKARAAAKDVGNSSSNDASAELL
eukprot:2800-Heterococcus_DN1.PRE.4